MDYSLKVVAVFVFYFISVISAQGGSYNGYGKIVGSNSGQSSDRGCIACKAEGRFYSPNAKFSYRDDCFTLNCFCYCNGTYVCPPEDSVYMCGNTRDRNTGNSRGTSGQIGGSSGSRTGPQRGDCRFCTPDNSVERIPPNTYFNYKNGCLEYTDCFCGCDGFWQCSNERVINSCPASSGHGVILGASDNNDGSCRRCNAHGKIVAPDTYFTYRNGCMEWFNCRCECDGSWQCPSDQGRWICENVCRECDINGTIHRANTDFRYTKDCFEYYPCHCHCNGSWHCPAENGRWACTDQCRTCDVKGMIKQGDTSFTYREDCWEWQDCMCHCNGSWRCPTENARWVCTSRCLECNVNGTRYKGNSVFQVTKGCYQFNCDCGCDGGWDCPSNRTIDICNMNATTMCYFCDVHGTRYQGNSFFSHKDGCINYTNCVCNCDGSWDCPGRSAIDTCRQNSSTGCYYCDVRGRQFQGQSRFQLEEDCWRFECECDCNGIWRCSEERAVYTCGQIRQGTCRECHAGGNRYAPRQPFVLPWGCINYNCHCNCDGSWICPAANADIRCSSGSFQQFQIATISSTPNSWCKECFINGQVYPGNSQFEYESNCVKHSFRCYCNGGYRKTFGVMGSCTKQILSGSISSSSTGVITSGRTSCTCIINGKTYPENSEVELKVGCASYSCRCTCDGFPTCRLVSNNLCRSVISAIGQTTVGSGGVILGSSGGSVSRTSSGGTTIVVAGEKRGSTEERIVTGGSSGTSTVVLTGSAGGGTILTGNRGCGYCIVEGRRYEGGTSFQFKRDCMLFSCQCDCNRRAVCTTKVTADCMPRPVPEYCQECTVHGRRYPPKSYFEYRHDCELYRCQCGCNGRESCTSEFIQNCRVDTCRPCDVNGQRRAPNSDFDLQDGCQRYRCHCKCNGIHKCSAPIDTCGGQPRRECRNCVLYGVTYPTNTPFLYERGCWRMRCNCDCDGYHNCDRRNAEYTCDINPPTRPKPKQCTRCLSDGIYYEANKKFTRRRGCLVQRCQCFCDGRVQCVRTDLYTCAKGTVIEPGSSSSTSQTRVVVTGTRTSTSRTSRTRSGGAVITSSTSVETVQRDDNCTTCMADNIERNPGTTFYLDRGCKRYTCNCPCEGRFSCETGTPENLCDESGSRRCRNCVVSDKTYTANQRFQLDYDECRKYQCICNCNGTYDCPRNEIINTCQREPRCQNCHYNNQMYPPNTRFSYTKGCEKFNCSCECDGMVLCPDDLTVDICTIDNTAGTCRNCLVEGRTFRTNQRFQYDEDCVRKDCFCNCDGTWRCPHSQNICQTEREKCRPCEVMGRMYRSNEKFQYDEKCYRYDCDCMCNGTYVCPAERTINICSGSGMINYTHECTECSVNGKRYSPNTRFAYDENCYRFDCDCRCNGSWVCPGERTRYICNRVETTTDSARECLPCVINNRAYRPESRFQYDSSCERYDCDCLCNGTYVCPAERTRDLCGGRTESGKCTPCVVEGRTYRTNSRFQYDSECIRYDCDCYCNGTHICPAERIRDFCGDRRGSEGGRDRCTACVVDGRRYRPKSRFRYDSECNRFDCRCLCNGTYVCPAERTRDICGGRDRPDEVGKCRPCVVNERSYRANTRFQYDSDCNRFDCDCMCNGSYVCPAERTRNICPGRGGGRGRDDSGRCKHCTVEGRRYRTESRFQYDSGCDRFDCDCRCDGSYVCPAERTRDLCGEKGGDTGRDKTGCDHCTVDGQTYRTKSRFQFERNCLRYDCDCFCNGSYNCPAERTRRVCNNDAPVNDDASQYQNVLPKTNCVKCKVRGQVYDPETKFKYSRRCYQYDCHCQCDGFYKCAAKRLKEKCGGSRKCKKNCDVRGVTYPGNSIFVLREGCMQKQCHCKCNGKWKCNPSKTVNVCKEN